ncbi:hypothetical protein FHW64_006452 [Variovorax sp. Sphag1AA]|nr:hypothetical protein [Variovorax sp. Sphag1AA]
MDFKVDSETNELRIRIHEMVLARRLVSEGDQFWQLD